MLSVMFDLNVQEQFKLEDKLIVWKSLSHTFCLNVWYLAISQMERLESLVSNSALNVKSMSYMDMKQGH